MEKHFKAVSLAYLDDETIKNIRVWRNKSFVKEKMYTQHEITEEEHSRYIQSLRENEQKGLFVFYLDNVPFGVYQYSIHQEGNYIISGNYLISEKDQELGYGTIMSYFIREINFNYLKVNKNYSEILDMNKQAISLAKRTGATLEGILRQQALVDGLYHDVYCFGLLQSEWNEKKNKYEDIIFSIVDKNYDVVM